MNKTTTNDYSNNSVFLDKLSKVNNLAKRKGFINARSWLTEAKKVGEITDDEFESFQSCHFLRNIIAHGGGTQLIITQQSIDLANEFFERISKSNLTPRATAVIQEPVVEAVLVPAQETAAPNFASAAPADNNAQSTSNTNNAAELLKRHARLKLINDPGNAAIVELKKAVAESLRTLKEYAKTPKVELEEVVIETILAMDDDDFKEALASYKPEPPRTLTNIKKDAISNLMNIYDLTTRKVKEGLSFLVRNKYMKEANAIYDNVKEAIANAKSAKEVETVYSKGITDLQSLEPKVKF